MAIPLRTVLIGGGGSSGTHLLAQQMNGMGGVRIGPEVRLTHQPALFDDDKFRRVFFKCLFNHGDQITYTFSSGTTYPIQPPNVFTEAAFYGFRTIDDLYDLFEQSRTFADLIRNIRRRVSEIRNWPSDFLWVEHTPRNGMFSRLLLDKYPDLRFIHMVRDGRDALLSQYKRLQSRFPGSSDDDLWSLATILWLVCQNGALLSDDHPRYIRLRYEDFVDEPEHWLRRLAEWMDVDYAPPEARRAVLGASASETGVVKASEWTLDPSGPVSNKAVGKWRRELSKEAFGVIREVEVEFPFFDKTLGFDDLQVRLGYSEPSADAATPSA